MQITAADAGKLRKSVTISYNASEYAARRNQVLRQLATEVKMPGFRPGKTSVALIEKRFGEAATGRTDEKLADEALNAALKEHGLTPIGQFTTDKVDRTGGAFIITLSFDIKPVVDLPAASEFTVSPAVVEGIDTEVDEQLKTLARRAGSMSPLAAGETIIEDDSVTVNGTITVDGAEIRKLDKFNHLVGGYPFFGKPSADIIALFKDQTIGAALSFTSILPASFSPAEYANKEAAVSITVADAQRLRGANLDDEFAKKLGVESLEKLTGLLRTRIEATKSGEARAKQVSELTEQLLAKVAIELPEKLLADTTKDAIASASRRNEGKSPEEIAKALAEAETESVKGLRRFLILDALALQQNVQVTNDDLNDQIHMAANHTGRKPEEVADQLKKSGRINQVVMEIREAKAIETLLDEVLKAKGIAIAAT